MLITIGYICALLMGAILGAIGGGGSILTVPILVYLFKLQPVEATTYSLLVVGFTALIGALHYHKKKLIQYKKGVIFALPAILGVAFSRTYLLPTLPETFHIFTFDVAKDTLVMFAFSLLMITISTAVLRHSKLKKQGKEVHEFLLAMRGFIVGCVTGFVGAGGGFLIVPSLILFANMPIKKAVATSLAIIATQALFGFTSDVIFNNFDVHILLILPFVMATSMGMVLGTKISHKLPETRLKDMFAIATLILGLIIALHQIYMIWI